MKLEELKNRIAAIEEAKADPEKAHALEDDLWFEVLAAIADGIGDGHSYPRQLAHEVRYTRNIDFPRWAA